MIYFDNSATTPIAPEVLETYVTVSKKFFGNPSSLNKLGLEAAEVLKVSRQQLKDLLNLKTKEIIFTSGGSEGDNLVIKGVALARKISGNHIIVSSIEHAAVLEAVKQLEKYGFEITYLKPNKLGQIDPKKLAEAIRPNTTLISIMAVNNETGAIQPISEIAEILQDHPQIVFHVDAVQAVGKNLEKLYSNPRIDFATFSGHKFQGPRGVGFIIYNPDRHLEPLINGGGQEKNLRSGTENTPAIAAMVKAFRISLEGSIENHKKYQKMKNILLDFLKDDPDFCLVSKDSSIYTPSIISFAVLGIKGETAVHYLEKKNIYISTTSACSSQNNKPSHVLASMNLPDEVLKGALRVSLGSQNMLSEMQSFINALKQMKEDIKVIN
ncbi:cysteine desulfurase family protein [Xylocopilactobacillus apis]|uniref:Aminotransferase V n=1 Tax=Xylocopilactobacillus apis TaxID=2932183 RepID=A0AAU9D139_9LACO|nr:cysteine desulfurase family protein [Xylocopilactobacillus apis]BDR56201.1 aminotransferase V [Xylocopilactobacillus apis]